MTDFDVPEAHDSLPGVPSPAENPLLVGHENARRLVAEAWRAGRLHHALLFDGPQGIGKATFAFHVVHHILSHPPSQAAPGLVGAPDPGSPAFRQVAQNAHPAVLYLTRPRNDRDTGFKTVVAVEEIRRINRFFGMTAGDGQHRIVIIDPAGDMNRAAANALLKNLEEPPKGALFILISHGAGRLLPTIRSRCQTIRLEPLPDELVLEAASRISGKDMPAAIARHAEGSVRQALLFTRFGGADIASALDTILAKQGRDVPASHALANAVNARGDETPFRLLGEHALHLLRSRAVAESRAGNIDRANFLAEQEMQLAERLRVSAAYNLDRKQEALQIISGLHGVLSPQSR